VKHRKKQNTPRCWTVPGRRLIRGREASEPLRLGGLGWRALAPPAGAGAEPREPAKFRAFVHSKLYQKIYLLFKISLKICPKISVNQLKILNL